MTAVVVGVQNAARLLAGVSVPVARVAPSGSTPRR